MFHDAVVHISTISQLQNEVEFGCCVDDLIKAHHIGMLHHLHAADLLEKVTLCHWVQLSLIYDFHRNLEESKNLMKLYYQLWYHSAALFTKVLMKKPH